MKYRTIVADPPWEYEQFIPSHTPRQAKSWRIDKPYKGMPVAAICALPVAELSADNTRLFLWTTGRFLASAFEVIAAWGFTYRQPLVWHKTGQPTPLPAVVAPNHAEFLLIADRGHPRRLGTLPSSVIAAPRRAHSAKPEVFLDEIERIAEPPYLELFARRQRLGWDTWGDEALNHVEMTA